MIIFYSWTFLQLLNMVNLKINYLSDQKSILFIASYEDTSRYNTILEKIKRSEVFNRIEVISFPEVMSNSKDKITREKRIRKYFKKLVYDKKITCVVPGYWGDCLLFLNCINKCYSLEEIYIVEEGLWIPDLKTIYQGVPWYKRIYYAGFGYRKYESKIKHVYAYKKFSHLLGENVKYYELPQITSDNGICYEILRNNNKNNEDYINSFDVLYLDSNLKIINFKELVDFYQEIFSVFDEKNKIRISVRLHPSGLKREKIYKNIRKELIIDREKRTMEEIGVFTGWKNKIVITIMSSAANNLSTMFGQSPYIIYINKIYKDLEIPYIIPCVDGIHTFMPQSMEEYKAMLFNIIEQLNK